MAVRDLFWGCPLCRAPGRIRKAGRRERCLECGATFRRDRMATIAVSAGGGEQVRSAAEWLEMLGPVIVPLPTADGVILGPEQVRVKRTTGQRPIHYGAAFLGWIETYGASARGVLQLRTDGLHLRHAGGQAEHWALAEITGLQPASSAIQLGFRGTMVSVKFAEGSVRLWTRALSGLIQDYHERQGSRVLELQPHIRLCRVETSDT